MRDTREISLGSMRELLDGVVCDAGYALRIESSVRSAGSSRLGDWAYCAAGAAAGVAERIASVWELTSSAWP